MKLFSLTVDFAFKSLFAPNPDLLISLINSFPSFQGKSRVVNLKVLNPEIPKEISSEKLSLLDIKAENELGEKFLIEMQAFAHSSFTKRALYYWAKTYSRSLNKGQDYEELKKVYSINFVKYSIWKNDSEYLSVFHVLEKTRKFPLTEDLEIYIVELSKFLQSFENLQTELEGWVYLVKESSNLRKEAMKTLEKKSPSLKKAISELKNLSRSTKSRELYEARLKAELDYNSGIRGAYRQGLNEGIEQGIEKGIEKGIERGIEKGIERGIEKGLYQSIQINLKTRFHITDESILKRIQQVRDIKKLEQILVLSIQAKTLTEFKRLLKKI